ncbi:MAG: hypothetical protein M9894_23095 [Planctomycetes bacterium]|nr:hypothetical protein [Planctomycetota bacterium]
MRRAVVGLAEGVGALRRAAVAGVLLAALAPVVRAQETARQAGDALRDALRAEAPRQDLVGRVRLPLYAGAARAGAINLRTDIVERDGAQVYRIHDRLDLDLPGLGATRMLVQADLRADLSAVEVVLETEEPRGDGAVSRHRVTLRRAPDGARWVRTVVRGEAAPVEEVVEAGLPADALVLTPPLGAGERLARLAPPGLGRRLSVRGLDLETGGGATWRLSVDDERAVRLADGGERRALVVVREEGAARLEALRDPAGGPPWRLAAAAGAGRPARLVALDPGLGPVELKTGSNTEGDTEPALRAVLSLLRAACSGDRAALREALDLDALAAAAPADASREAFEAVLLERLTDPAWLSDRGLTVTALAVGPADFVVETDGPGRARVRPRTSTPGEEDAAFLVTERAGAWRIARLPRSSAARPGAPGRGSDAPR